LARRQLPFVVGGEVDNNTISKELRPSTVQINKLRPLSGIPELGAAFHNHQVDFPEADHPLTNGMAGGKLPSGKSAFRFPGLSWSAASRKAVTNA
jgi:hypothetical protein